MSEREWKLGEDLFIQDNALDGFTFEQLIIALHSGSRRVDADEVRKVVKEIVDQNLEDMWFLIEKNMDKIISESLKGRKNYE